MTSQWSAAASGLKTSAAPASKIGDHRVHRHAAPGDQDPCLSRGAKICFNAACGKGARQGKRRVLLADGAIGADGQKAFSRTLEAGCDRNMFRRRTHIDETAAVAFRGELQLRHVAELRVHAADDIETRLERLDERRDPIVGDDAACVGDADDERACAAGACLLRCQARQIRGDGRPRARPFTDAAIPRPVPQSEGRLGVALLRGIAQKQQIRMR